MMAKRWHGFRQSIRSKKRSQNERDLKLASFLLTDSAESEASCSETSEWTASSRSSSTTTSDVTWEKLVWDTPYDSECSQGNYPSDQIQEEEGYVSLKSFLLSDDELESFEDDNKKDIVITFQDRKAETLRGRIPDKPLRVLVPESNLFGLEEIHQQDAIGDGEDGKTDEKRKPERRRHKKISQKKKKHKCKSAPELRTKINKIKEEKEDNWKSASNFRSNEPLILPSQGRGEKCSSLIHDDIMSDDHGRRITSDITVWITERPFPAHKIVLYSMSGYFRDIIERSKQAGGPTGGHQLDQLEVEGVPEHVFDELLHFMYTRQMPDMSHDDFQEILQCASKLKIKDVGNELLDFLERSFDAANAIALYEYAVAEEGIHRKGAGNFLARCRFLLLSNFKRIMENSNHDFCRIHLQTLQRILSDDDLLVDSEMEVFRAAFKWLAYDWKRRKGHAFTLMRHVRFALLSQEELLACLKQMERWNVMELEDMKDLMMGAFQYKMGGVPRGSKSGDAATITRPRSCIAEQMSRLLQVADKHDDGSRDVSLECDGLKIREYPSILLFGGSDPIRTCEASANGRKNGCRGYSVYQFLPEEQRWRSVASSPKIWQHPGVTEANKDTVYVCGGCELPEHPWLMSCPGSSHTGACTRRTWCYNASQDIWVPLPDMTSEKVHHAAVTWQGKLYAIGGINGNSEVLDTVECYNPLVEQWTQMAAMPRACLGMAASQFNDLIWVCGGILRTPMTAGGTKGVNVWRNSGQICDLVQVYNPRKNRWYMSSSLRIPRAFACLTVIRNRLYLIGGISHAPSSSSTRSISDVDVYEVYEDTWRHATDMFLPRHCCSAASIGRHLYVIGGISGAMDEVLTSVERFDTLTGQWCCLGGELPIKLSGMGCVVLPPNYTHNNQRQRKHHMPSYSQQYKQ